jgi:hypothetical protein
MYANEEFWQIKIKEDMVGMTQEEYLDYCLEHKTKQVLLLWPFFGLIVTDSLILDKIRNTNVSHLMIHMLIVIKHNKLNTMQKNIYCPPENITQDDLFCYLNYWKSSRDNGELFKLFLEHKYNVSHPSFLVYCPPHLWDKFLNYCQSNGIHVNYNQITYALRSFRDPHLDDEFFLIACVLYNHKLLTDYSIFNLFIEYGKTYLIETFIKKLSLQCDDTIKVAALFKKCYEHREFFCLFAKYQVEYRNREGKVETDMKGEEFSECLDYAFMKAFEEFSQSKDNVLPAILSLLSNETSKREVIKTLVNKVCKFQNKILSDYFNSVIAS